MLRLGDAGVVRLKSEFKEFNEFSELSVTLILKLLKFSNFSKIANTSNAPSSFWRILCNGWQENKYAK